MLTPRITSSRACARSSGFTLIEMMVTVSVAAILLALAVPSFRTQIANQQVSAGAQEVQTLLLFARSEAVYKRSEVQLTASSQTWSVKLGDKVLRESVISEKVSVAPGTGAGDGISFDLAGNASPISGESGDFKLGFSATGASRVQCLSVSRTGLVRQERKAADASC